MLGWSMLDWFGCSWVMPNKLSIMFEAWSMYVIGFFEGKNYMVILVYGHHMGFMERERCLMIWEVLFLGGCFDREGVLLRCLLPFSPSIFHDTSTSTILRRWVVVMLSPVIKTWCLSWWCPPLADIFLKKESLVRVCFYFKIEIYICLLVSCAFLCFRW